MTTLVAIGLGCTSAGVGSRPPTPEEGRVLDALRRDSAAVDACAARTRSSRDQRVYLDSEVDQPAVLLPGRTPPELPRRDGNAVVVVVVLPDGRPDLRTAALVRATYFELGDSVLALVRRARYRPAVLNGRPVAQCVIVPVTVRT